MNHYLGKAYRENNQRFVDEVKKVSEHEFKNKLATELEKVPLKQVLEERVTVSGFTLGGVSRHKLSI